MGRAGSDSIWLPSMALMSDFQGGDLTGQDVITPGTQDVGQVDQQDHRAVKRIVPHAGVQGLCCVIF